MQRGTCSLTHISILLLFLLFTQSDEALCQLLPLRYYTVNDGLVSRGVTTLEQDSRGFLWIGTSEGISVYDGYEFRNYHSHEGLPVNFITDIRESRSVPGVMWISTLGGGVSKFVDGSFRQYSFGTTPEANQINTLLEDNAGRLVCIAHNDVFLLAHDTVSRFPRPRHSTRPLSVAQSHTGDIWIGTTTAIEVYASDLRQRGRLRHQLTTALYRDSKGFMWAGSASGQILRFMDTVLVETYHPAKGNITHIVEDTRQNIWVSSSDGLFHITVKNNSIDFVTRYSTENGLHDNRLGTVFVDREGVLWFGGFNQGLYKWAERDLLFFPFPLLEAGHLYYPAAAADSAGTLWSISPDGLIELKTVQRGGWKQFVHPLSGNKKERTLTSIQFDQRGSLWTASSAGDLQCWNVIPNASGPSTLKRKKSPWPKAKMPPDPWLFHAFDRDNNMWICVVGRGLYVVDTLARVQRVFTQEDGLPATDLRTFHQDRSGNIWVGGFAGGLAMLPAGGLYSSRFRLFTAKDGLPDERIRYIYEDNERNIWIGTRFAGLAVLLDGLFHTISIKDGLISNAVWWITEDLQGRLWVGTQMGLQSIDKETRRPLKAAHGHTGKSVICCGVLNESHVWAYTPDGLLIHSLDDNRPQIPPPIHITRMEVNASPLDFLQPLSLSYDQNFCTIEFVGIIFADEAVARYQFRLLDTDPGWSKPTPQRSVTYASLQPGDYRFEVRALGSGDVVSSAPAFVMFTIDPPLWGTWWFRLAALAAVVTLLFLVYRFRVTRLLEVERMRVRIASDLHDDVGSTLTKISLYSDIVKNDPGRSNDLMEKIGGMSRDLITNMSDIVWSIDARNDTMEDLTDRMKDFSLSLLGPRNVDVSFVTDGLTGSRKLASDVRQNVYLIFKEAINNIVKHSSATSVIIRLGIEGREFYMSVHDNGKGLNGGTRLRGNGLRNMSMRAGRIGATLRVTNEDGVTVHLSLTGP